MTCLVGSAFCKYSLRQALTEKMCLPLLLVSIAMGIVYTVRYFGENYAETGVLQSLFTNVYAWFMVLAILGCGKKWFDRQYSFGAYMTKTGYGLYVIHYTFVLIPCFYLKNNTELPAWAVYIAALLIVFVCTPVSYEIISRIPVARCFVLGIRRKNDKG